MVPSRPSPSHCSMLFISRLNGFVCKIVYLAGAQARNRAGNGAGMDPATLEAAPSSLFELFATWTIWLTLVHCVTVWVCMCVLVGVSVGMDEEVCKWGSTAEVFIERKCSLTLYNLLVLEAIRTDKCLSIDLDWLGRSSGSVSLLALASAFVNCEEQDRLTALHSDALVCECVCVLVGALNRCQQAGPMLGNSINPSQQLFPNLPFHSYYFLFLFLFPFSVKALLGRPEKPSNEGTRMDFLLLKSTKWIEDERPRDQSKP